MKQAELYAGYMAGRLAAIYLRPAARTPVKEAASAEAVAGCGLSGDHAGGGSRQVSLMSREAWADVCADLGDPQIEPRGRRANLLVEGVDLPGSIGGRIAIGPGCVIAVVAELAPCRLMDDFRPGLQNALKPACRGGVYGRVVRGGALRVGDEVKIVTGSEQKELFA